MEKEEKYTFIQTFIKKHFSATWNDTSASGIVGKYAWITLIVSAILSVYICSIINFKNESIIMASICVFLNFIVARLSKYASTLLDKKDKEIGIKHNYIITIKKFVDELVRPWSDAKNEDKDKKNPLYTDQHWFIKGWKYCWESSVLNRNMTIINVEDKPRTYIPILLFILYILLYLLYECSKAQIVLYIAIFVAYLQYSASNLITLRNENRLCAISRGLIRHFHNEHGKGPDIKALNGALCNKKKEK